MSGLPTTVFWIALGNWAMNRVLLAELYLSHCTENGEPGLGGEELFGETVVVIL